MSVSFPTSRTCHRCLRIILKQTYLECSVTACVTYLTRWRSANMTRLCKIPAIAHHRNHFADRIVEAHTLRLLYFILPQKTVVDESFEITALVAPGYE